MSERRAFSALQTQRRLLRRARKLALWGLLALVFCVPLVLTRAAPAVAQDTTTTLPTATPATAEQPTPPAPEATSTTASGAGPTAPVTPTVPGAPADANGPSVNLQLPTGTGGVTSQPLTIVLLLTVVALGPSMLMLMTAFTRIVIVLGLTRNALNLQGTPPNQVLIGLSLFLTLFVMAPVFSQANRDALQPYLKGEITQQDAYTKGIEPFREFMFDHVRESDLELFTSLSGAERPRTAADVPTATLVPAFVIGELRAAFLIGFVIFIPFLVIDLVVSSALMSMGMVMLPPVTIALPFKLLLFVVVDGWALTAGTLVNSFKT